MEDNPFAEGPLFVSWSSLRRYELCGQKHLRVAQGKGNQAVDSRNYFAGTVADLACKEWLLNPEPGTMPDIVHRIVQKLTEPKTAEEKLDPNVRPIKWRGNPAEDKATLTQFVIKGVQELEPILLDRIVPLQYKPAVWFRAPIAIPYIRGDIRAAVILRGEWDIITRDPETGDWGVWDLKMTKDPQYVRKTLGQAIFYDIAFGHWIKDREQPKEFGFIFPAIAEKVMMVSVSDADRRAMLARIIKMCHGIWRKEFDPKKDDEGCNKWGCEVSHACPKFSLDMHVDEAGVNRVEFV